MYDQEQCPRCGAELIASVGCGGFEVILHCIQCGSGIALMTVKTVGYTLPVVVCCNDWQVLDGDRCPVCGRSFGVESIVGYVTEG